MSGLFGSITIKGNRLTEMVGQTSSVGRPIPFGYGLCRIQECNVIWTAGIPKEHVKKKKQGKGGVKTETYTYTLSYAIGVIAGPIHGYLTIKRGGKVVFTTDPTATVDDQAYAAKWLQKVELYYGTEDQMPDPTIESYEGAGNVSAFRGLAYFVVTDDDVTNEGGAVPQYEAIVIATPPEIYVTSHPYVISEPETVTLLYAPVEVVSRQILRESYDDTEITLGYAALGVNLKDQYNNTIISDNFSISYAAREVVVTNVLKVTATQPESASIGYTATNIVLTKVLIVLEPSSEQMSLNYSAIGVILS